MRSSGAETAAYTLLPPRPDFNPTLLPPRPDFNPTLLPPRPDFNPTLLPALPRLRGDRRGADHGRHRWLGHLENLGVCNGLYVVAAPKAGRASIPRAVGGEAVGASSPSRRGG